MELIYFRHGKKRSHLEIYLYRLDDQRPPEKLDMQTVGNQHWLPFQFLTSLLPVRRGWFANHALQPTPVGVVSSAFAAHTVVPAWLSLGR